MIQLWYYTLSAFGLWYIVGASVISYPLRHTLRRIADSGMPVYGLLLDLVQCPACFGFWIGLAAGFTRWSPMLDHDPLMLALYTSATNLLLGTLSGLMPEGEER